jgi:hypothetical protein
MSLAELKDRQATLALTFITVPISESTSGDKTIRAIQPGQKFSVYGLWLKASGGAVNITWKSGSTSITGAIPLSDGEYINIFQEVPILKSRATGDDLILNLSANIGVYGWVNLTVS